MKTAPLALAFSLLLSGLSSANSGPQDYDNLDACCLAAEYRLPQSRPRDVEQPSAQRQSAAQLPCQVQLGELACCVGAEWKLDAR